MQGRAIARRRGQAASEEHSLPAEQTVTVDISDPVAPVSLSIELALTLRLSTKKGATCHQSLQPDQRGRKRERRRE
ncbi:hypothetical protein KC363_g48 [Hortaea werneckii]|nr:hypothetical protein KC363_g48 [Hortaea werneckii]